MNSQEIALDFIESLNVEKVIEHLSETPWSAYTAADYSIEQWHAACLIHQHEGPPTSKSQCKLPVKTPSGAVNKNGVHAAAAALAGARTPINASAEEKSKAAKALIGFYHQMNEQPPPSLLKHSNVEDFIRHHGTKGMKWGVRKDASRADKQWAKNIYTIQSAVAIHNEVANMVNYRGDLDKINKAHPKAHLDHDTPETRAYLKAYEKMVEGYTREAVKTIHGTSPTGGYKAELGRKDGEWAVVVKATDVQHAIKGVPWEDLTIPLIVKNGKIVGVKFSKEQAMNQSDTQMFIEHYGKKGMKWGVRSSRVKTSSDFKKTAHLRNRKTRELSNKQIQSINARINMEQQYKRLNPNKAKIGADFAKGVLAAATTMASVYALAKSPAGQAGIAAVKKILKTKA